MSLINASFALLLFATSMVSAHSAFAAGVGMRPAPREEVSVEEAQALREEAEALQGERLKTARDIGVCIIAAKTHGIAGIIEQVSKPGMTNQQIVTAVLNYSAVQGLHVIKNDLKGYAVGAAIKLIPVVGEIKMGYDLAQRAKRVLTCRKIVQKIHDGSFAGLRREQCDDLVAVVEEERELNDSIISKYYRARISPVMKNNCVQMASAIEVLHRLHKAN